MADEVVTRCKSVKLHHYWPCTVVNHCRGIPSGLDLGADRYAVLQQRRCQLAVTSCSPFSEQEQSVSTKLRHYGRLLKIIGFLAISPKDY